MPKLSELLEATNVSSVEISDGLSVQIKSFALWDARLSEADWEAARAMTGREYYARVLPALLQWWDVLDTEGHTIPVTSEVIMATDHNALPIQFLRRVEAAALTAKLPNRSTD